MTVALGVLAGTGIVIAADTEGNIGEHKVTTLKTMTGFPYCKDSALAITGAGNSWYIETLTQRLERVHCENEAISTDDLADLFQAELEDFYTRHVIPFNDDALDIQLIIGVQRKGVNALWATAENTMREVCSQVVGVGDIQARDIMDRASMDSIADGVLIACCAIYQAEQKTKGCGQSTTVDCLYNNCPHHVFPDLISNIETWFEKYLGASGSTFAYAIGHRFPDRDKHLDRVANWYRELRSEAEVIKGGIVNDLNSSA